MAKFRSKYVCQSCGYESAGYLGRCPECGEWGSFIEEISSNASTTSNTIENSASYLKYR